MSRARAGAGLLVAVAVLLVGACGSSEPSADDPVVTPSQQVTTTVEAAAAPTTAQVATSAEPGTSSASPTTEPEPDPLAPPAADAALPTDGATMAEALTLAEGAIRDPAVTDAEAAAWGRHQQRLYLHLARNPSWVEEAIALEDPLLRRAAEANWTARVNLDALVDSEAAHTEVPAWRIVDPRPVDELLGYYRDGEAEWGIDWTYLAAINLIETRMGRIEGVSTAGAVGPMQFLPTTWAECCDGDATNPADAIPGAARYLTIRGGPEDMERAIWGYNNSDRYVAAVTAYASVMRDDELAYRGYHAWQIYFRSTEGLLLLPVGYEELEAIPAATWLQDNPDGLIP